MLPFKPQQIFIHPSVLENDITRRIVERVPDVPQVVQTTPPTLRNDTLDPVGDGKRIWFLTTSPGQLVKECPATPLQLCCRYRVINVITNCPIDCSYCILQGYLNSPCITIHVNLNDIMEHVDQYQQLSPDHITRFGTGELSDSLALEPYTGFSRDLARFFRDCNRAFFEIKTKCHQVEDLLQLDPKGKVGISWSVNPDEIIRHEEHGASSLMQRLAAASSCQRSGYLIGFHFDPIICYPDWETGYRAVVERIFSLLDPKRISWFSLGGFRYPSFLRPVIQARFPQSALLLGELFAGPDGKHRYFRKLRIQLYKNIVGWIREYDPDPFIYFCMESPDVWEAVFGRAPENRDHLDHQFSQRIRRLWKQE